MVQTEDYLNKMFDNLGELIESTDEEDWAGFKKWVRKNEATLNPWYFTSNGLRLWNMWSNMQEAKEREKLEKEFSYKKKRYLCKTCGKRKAENEFCDFDRTNVHGLRAYVWVRTGSGLCSDCFLEESAKKAEREKDYIKEYKAKWYQAHKEEISERQRQRRHSTTEQNRAWQSTHRDQINQHIRERKQKDPVFKLKSQARTAIYQSFTRTGNVKQERCESITGLKIDDLVAYLCETYEQTYGKKWDGVEPIHIDHIVPLATAKDEADVKRLCHYSNLRLLTAQDNLKKGAKFNYAV